MFLYVLGNALQWLAAAYTIVLLARVAFDWARVLAPRWVPPGPVLWVADWVYRLTDPPIMFLRKYIPPLRLGAVALDVGFVVVFVGVALVGRLGQILVWYAA